MRAVVIVVLGLLLVACSGTGSGAVGTVTPAIGRAPVLDLVSSATADSNLLKIVPDASDPDGDALVYNWSVDPASVSPVVLFEVDQPTGETTCTFPLNGFYHLRLRVDDGNGNQVTRSVSVTVADAAHFTISGAVNDDGVPTSGLDCELFFLPVGETLPAAMAATVGGGFSFEGVIGARDQFSVLVPGS